MNILLLFFALPIATIILAVAVNKILRCPILTSAVFFAIFLVLAFAVFENDFLIFVIVYTILAFISALISEIFFRRCNSEKCCCKLNWSNCRENNNNTTILSNQDIRRIAEELSRIQNNGCCSHNKDNSCSVNEIATVSVTNNTNAGRTTWCCSRR